MSMQLRRTTILVSFAGACSLLASGQSQTPTAPGVFDRIEVAPISPSYETAPGTGLVQLVVFSEKSARPLDRQALIKLTNLQTQATTWQTTEERSQAMLTNVPFGNYSIEVSAVGYVTSTQQMNLLNLSHPLQLSVVLQKDPTSINLDVPDAAVPSKGRKAMKQGISALKSGRLKDAEKHLNSAYALAPGNSQLNFLLGYLHFQRNEFDQAEKYLKVAAAQEPSDVQTITLLGRTELERKEFAEAQRSLEKAVELDPGPWMTHSLLADSYLRQGDYDRARQQSTLAIEKGKDAAASAQLVLGQAQLGLGQREAAIQALNTFLRLSPHSSIEGQVRALIDQLEKQGANLGTQVNSDALPVKGVDPLSALPASGLAVQPWQPVGVDEVKPSVASGVSCPLAQVLASAGERVSQLVEDVARFAAVEELFHQRLDEFGVPQRTETRKFNYVASIAETEPGFLEVSEYRADRLELSGYPDHIASTGFAGLALVFHPHIRDEFEMSCEGLGDWHGQATWLVHFRQREDRPSRMHSYKVGTQLYPVNLKGRAWIRADNFQIVRMESDLVRPMPQVKLLSEHQVVEYAPIPFGKTGIVLWLPKSAEIYFDFRKQRYYRRHSFEHYMLFAVNSEERRKEPVAPPNSVPPAPEPH
jgi:tetratricopeptide (TPR) repeat protein